MLNLKPNEEAFEIKPVGIRYKCEFCNEGEMKYENKESVFIEAVNKNPIMHNHICTKCGKTMLLPKMYPYVEWTVSINEDKIDN